MKVPRIEVYDDVYNPAEDSYFLLSHVWNIKGRILDMGSGSGIIALTIALNNPENEVVGTDINPIAIENANHNALINRIENVHFIISDLFSNVRGVFDYIVFNPPYLPTSKEDVVDGNLNYAFDGGEKGDDVILRFAKECSHFIKPSGAVYLLASSFNRLSLIEKTFVNNGFSFSIEDKKEMFFESLFLIKAQYKQNFSFQQ